MAGVVVAAAAGGRRLFWGGAAARAAVGLGGGSGALARRRPARCPAFARCWHGALPPHSALTLPPQAGGMRGARPRPAGFARPLAALAHRPPSIHSTKIFAQSKATASGGRTSPRLASRCRAACSRRSGKSSRLCLRPRLPAHWPPRSHRPTPRPQSCARSDGSNDRLTTTGSLTTKSAAAAAWRNARMPRTVCRGRGPGRRTPRRSPAASQRSA